MSLTNMPHNMGQGPLWHVKRVGVTPSYLIITDVDKVTCNCSLSADKKRIIAPHIYQ